MEAFVAHRADVLAEEHQHPRLVRLECEEAHGQEDVAGNEQDQQDDEGRHLQQGDGGDGGGYGEPERDGQSNNRHVQKPDDPHDRGKARPP